MDPITIVVFLILFLLSAFFSGSETAFMSVPFHKVEAFLKQKRFGARNLKKLKSNTDRLLITILVGNNLVNTFTASFATSIAMDIAVSLGSTQSAAIGVATGVVTILLLIFGEIFPKTLATRYADKIALGVSGIYSFLQIILFPVIRCIERLMKLLQRKKVDNKITDEEVDAFIEMGNDSGVFEAGEYEKVKNMLDFYEITCEEVMTPRVKIDAIPCTMIVDQAIEKLLTFSHSRILVYDGDIDHVERVVTLRELLQVQKKGRGNFKLSELSLGPVIKVPLTKPIHSLLDLFKRSRRHVAAVIDEYGGVAGLVSMEDVVEEVFGDIQDEFDNEVDPIRNDGNGSYLFQSEVRIDEMLEKFELDFSDVDIDEAEFSGETLGYYVMSYFERFPKKGDEIDIKIQKFDTDDLGDAHLSLRVMGVRNNKIGDIKVTLID